MTTARHAPQISSEFFPRTKSIALICKLSLSACDRECRQRSRNGQEEKRSSCRQERPHRAHEIDVSDMVRRSKVPKKKIQDLEKFAAATPNAKRQRYRRYKKGANRPGDETELFPCNK